MISESDWQQAVIPAWKLAVLRLAFPHRRSVVLRGRMYLIRSAA